MCGNDGGVVEGDPTPDVACLLVPVVEDHLAVVADSAGSGDAMYMMKPGPGGPPSMPGMPGPGVSECLCARCLCVFACIVCREEGGVLSLRFSSHM